VLRSRSLARLLWSVTGSAALISCGRLGFGEDAAAVVTPPVELVTECGVEPVPGSVEIVNDGTIALVVEAATTTGGFTVVTPLPLVIEAGENGALAIAPPAAVIGTDVSGAIKTGTLTIVTNDGASRSQTLDLSARVVGAQLQLNGSAMPVALTFSANNACPADQFVTFVNKGDRPVTLQLEAQQPGFQVQFFLGGTLDAGNSSTAGIAVDTAAPCSGSATITYAVTGSLCSANPVVFDASFTITNAANCACS